MLSKALLSRIQSTDWDFPGKYSESPFSSIHWHPSRFASQVPATLIGLLSEPNELVLDPFLGSGTTLVEAQRLGRPSIGIELNPVSCLIAEAKTLAITAKTIGDIVSKLKEEATGLLSSQLSAFRRSFGEVEIPNTVQATKWYGPNVRKDLRRLWALVIASRGNSETIARAAFSAILLPICRETRHWGYVCDNSRPKARHEGDVLTEFLAVLDRLEAAYRQRDEELIARGGAPVRPARASVSCGDARKVLRSIERESAGVVVTSPPYFSVSDYVKAQRLSFEWFGFEIEPLRLQEIGARSKRHRLSAKDEYLKGLSDVFREIRRCMRHQSILAVILGESTKRPRVVKKIVSLIEAKDLVLQCEIVRSVSAQRRQAPSLNSEHLLFFSKTGGE